MSCRDSGNVDPQAFCPTVRPMGRMVIQAISDLLGLPYCGAFEVLAFFKGSGALVVCRGEAGMI